MGIRRILHLIVKEFLSVLQDRKSRFVLVIPPLIQLFVFSYAATLEVKNVSLGVVNEDSGALSHELIERFRGSPTFSKVILLSGSQQIAKEIDTQEKIAVLQFSSTFSRDLLSEKPAQVELILDGRKSNTSQIIMGYAQAIITQFNVDQLAKRGIKPKEPSILLVPRNWFNANLTYSWFTVPGLVATLSMMTSLIITAMTVARERELGTFDQLLVSPLSPTEILLGKMIPGIVIGIIQATLMICAALYIFGVPLTGSLWLLYGSLFFFISSIVGVGLFLSALATTQQQALLYTFIFIAPAITLSGFATPIENMPAFLQTLTDINPLKHFLLVCRGVFLKEFDFDQVLSHTYPLILIAIINLLGATWFFKRRTY